MARRWSIVTCLLVVLSLMASTHAVGYTGLESTLVNLDDDLAGLLSDGLLNADAYTYSGASSSNPYAVSSSNTYGYDMSDAERMLTTSYGGAGGYMQAMGYQMPQQSYAPQTMPMTYPPQGYGYQQQQQQPQKKPSRGGYDMQQQKKKKKKKKQPKKVYVPIVIRKKKQKKRKTIAVYKGFYIPGGTQVFGKFKKMKDCKKICEVTPNCFAADYNAHIKKCYLHTNITACEEMRSHPKLIHFKKIPCDLVETQRGLITLGAQAFGGLLQKGIKSLQDCIKKCATAGQGIVLTNADIADQVCFGIDYDFATHKCYFHTDEFFCPNLAEIPTPSRLVAAPSVVNILLCPQQMTG